MQKGTLQIHSIPYPLHKKSEYPHFIFVLSRLSSSSYFPFVLLALENLPLAFISVIGRSVT